MTICGKAQLTSLCISTPHGTLLSSASTNHTHTRTAEVRPWRVCLQSALVAKVNISGEGWWAAAPLPQGCVKPVPRPSACAQCHMRSLYGVPLLYNEEVLIISPFSNLKEIVHPKIKILSCTHPQVFPNLSEFQKTVFWRMLLTKDFYLFLYYGYWQLFDYKHFSKIVLCVQQKK